MFWEVLLNAVLDAIVPVLVTAFLGFLAKLANDFVKANISAKNLAMVKDFSDQLVLAAEQSGLAGYIKDEGQAKKEWVVNRLESALKENNIKFPVRLLSDIIEASVFKFFSEGQREADELKIPTPDASG